MSPFWTGDYFDASYWPEGYFGPEQETNPGAMSATLAGSGGLTATASAVGDLTATLAGSGAVTGTIASGTIVTRPPVVIPYPPIEYPVPAFISARLAGGGTLGGKATATADASATIIGRAELAAALGATVDISASLAGGGGLDATGTTRGRGFAADNDFWLLAA